MKTTATVIALMLSFVMSSQTCTIMMTPQNQIVSCNLSSIQQVTISTSPANVINKIISPLGGIVSSTNNPVIYHPIGTGTYTYILTDAVTGCTNMSQFTVGSATTFPTFSLTSGTNFLLGCDQKSVDIVGITSVSVQSNPTYTLLSPGSSTVLPNAPLSNQTNYNITSPGTYTVVVRSGNNCQTRMPFTVSINTILPNFALGSYVQTLTCSNPTTILSNTISNTTYTWSYMTNTLSNTNYTCSNSGTYSLSVENPINACKVYTTLILYANKTTPTVNISATFSIDCTTNVAIVSPIQPNMSYNYSWSGGGTTYTMSTSTPGNYTLNVINPDNGCQSSSVITVEQCSTVGIKEYSINPQEPLEFYDFMGNLISKRFNEVIIWKQGNRTGKVIFEQ